MQIALLVDFGSTYTKATAVDLESGLLIGHTQAASTVGTDIMLGLNRALGELGDATGLRVHDYALRLACSSAAGGLGMVAVGLVKELTAEAARQAALGAGAKLMRVYSYGLTRQDLAEMERVHPDIILLAGGTDGGNTDVILRNARTLAGSSLQAPVVVAGNRDAGDEVCAVLTLGGKQPILTENVLPQLDRLNVEPARAAIRDLFMHRIVHAKGLDGAQDFMGRIVMPTPVAVLNAARLLAEGTSGDPGLGDLLVVDVGGATTDVHSVGEGTPSREGVLIKGIPEPCAKRTVEGDLGIRWNAPSILGAAGAKSVLAHAGLGEAEIDLGAAVNELREKPEQAPADDVGMALDVGLARTATHIAVRRHAGVLETVYTPAGRVDVQHGKDLSAISTVIGTGGVFAWGSNPRRVLEIAIWDANDPCSLRPKAPRLKVDARYILYAAGLLAEVAAPTAFRLARRHLEEV